MSLDDMKEVPPDSQDVVMGNMPLPDFDLANMTSSLPQLAPNTTVVDFAFPPPPPPPPRSDPAVTSSPPERSSRSSDPNIPTAREMRARRNRKQPRPRNSDLKLQRPLFGLRGTPGQLTFGAIVERLRRARSGRVAVLAAIRARCIAMCYAKHVQAERFGGLVAAGKMAAEKAERSREELGSMREAFGGDEAAEFGHLSGQMERLAAEEEEVVFRCCQCKKAGRTKMVGDGEELCECGHVCCILCLYVQREGDEMIEMELLSLEEPGRMDGKMGSRKDGDHDGDGGLGGDTGMAMDVVA